jgi:hypothetical protein
VEFGENWSLEASGRVEMEELLEAALGDWIDFIFVPTPELVPIFKPRAGENKQRFSGAAGRFG